MWDGLWVILPLLGGYIAHAPVLRFDWFRPLAQPIDGGATYRGRRVFGDNKTWRGALVMLAGVIAATLLLARVPGVETHWPAPLRDHPLGFGCLLGLGFVLGELPNSFLKRQLSIAPGARQRSPLGVALALFDQADFVPGIWMTLSLLWRMPVAQTATVFLVALAVHLIINVIGYAIGARKSLL